MYTFQWTAESSFHETLEDPRLPQSPEYPFRSCRWGPTTKASVRSGFLEPFNVNALDTSSLQICQLFAENKIGSRVERLLFFLLNMQNLSGIPFGVPADMV